MMYHLRIQRLPNLTPRRALTVYFDPRYESEISFIGFVFDMAIDRDKHAFDAPETKYSIGASMYEGL